MSLDADQWILVAVLAASAVALAVAVALLVFDADSCRHPKPLGPTRNAMFGKVLQWQAEVVCADGSTRWVRLG